MPDLARDAMEHLGSKEGDLSGNQAILTAFHVSSKNKMYNKNGTSL